MKKSITVKTFLDTRYQRKDGTYPLQLRVYSPRPKQSKRYNIEQYVTLETYERATGPRPRGEYKELYDLLQEWEVKAKEVAKKITPFDFNLFERRMDLIENGNASVFGYYKQLIDEMKDAGRIGTATSYADSMKALVDFLRNPNRKGKAPRKTKDELAKEAELPLPSLSFARLTPKFLQMWEDWMVRTGKSETTVGIYMRALRAVWNAAKKPEDLEDRMYPFGDDGYVIPGGKNIKKALFDQQLATLWNHPVDDKTGRKEAKDWWFFLFQAQGVNVKDVSEWKYDEHYDFEKIVFFRQKVYRTTKANRTPIVIAATVYIKWFIETYGNPYIPGSYVFDIANDTMTAEEKHRAVKAKIWFINNNMNKIAKEAGIKTRIGNMVARHSFSTKAIADEIFNTNELQKSLGHTDPKTTQNYVDTLYDAGRLKKAERLMDFAQSK